jgi:hypothetical protein
MRLNIWQRVHGLIAPAAQPVATLDPLAAVNAAEFERAWQMYSDLRESEFHFNQLQTEYRKLASTWLLATFGAVGFVTTSGQLVVPIDHLLIASLVCIAGSAGILLLWNLDLMVYQGLLLAGFAIGREMEQEFWWLPKVRTEMNRRYPKGVHGRVTLFYVGATVAPLLIGTGLFALWSVPQGPAVTVVAVVAWTVLWVGLALYMVNERPAESADA